MNFLAKHVLFNLVAQQAVKYGSLGVERALAKFNPDAHQKYVETVTEIWDAKVEAFILRNANLVTEKVSDTLTDENVEVAKQQIQKLFEGIAAEFNKSKGTDEK